MAFCLATLSDGSIRLQAPPGSRVEIVVRDQGNTVVHSSVTTVPGANPNVTAKSTRQDARLAAALLAEDELRTDLDAMARERDQALLRLYEQSVVHEQRRDPDLESLADLQAVEAFAALEAVSGACLATAAGSPGQTMDSALASDLETALLLATGASDVDLLQSVAETHRPGTKKVCGATKTSPDATWVAGLAAKAAEIEAFEAAVAEDQENIEYQHVCNLFHAWRDGDWAAAAVASDKTPTGFARWVEASLPAWAADPAPLIEADQAALTEAADGPKVPVKVAFEHAPTVTRRITLSPPYHTNLSAFVASVGLTPCPPPTSSRSMDAVHDRPLAVAVWPGTEAMQGTAMPFLLTDTTNLAACVGPTGIARLWVLAE